MNLRLKRLTADFERISRLIGNNRHIAIKSTEGNPPERYEIEYCVNGLEKVNDLIVSKDVHLAEIVLPLHYPREAPLCRMLSPVFHPNIAPHAICIGDHWVAGESLADLIVRIGEMLTFQSYNIKSPLNGEAAQWADENRDRLPLSQVDLSFERGLTRIPVPIPVASGSFNDDSIENGTTPPTPPPFSPPCSGNTCKNCGASDEAAPLQSCKHGHSVCLDCMLDCQSCGNLICLLCTRDTCKVCGKLICNDCKEVCAECGTISCRAHLKPRRSDERRICPSCQKKHQPDVASNAPPFTEPSSKIPCVTLYGIKGPVEHATYSFSEPTVLIAGRGGPGINVDIKLPDDDPYVSRRHFLLEISPPRIFLKDIGSTNPPSVNGIITLVNELFDGDVIEVGYSEFRVQIIGRAVEAGESPVFTSITTCKTCGMQLEMLPGESPPDSCPFCKRSARIAAAIPNKRSAASVVCQCGKDLSSFANSDERGEDLSPSVLYMCASCVDKRTEIERLRIGPYELLDTIGIGGMGIVYKVYHRPTARIMALKQVSNLHSSPDVIRRFEREVRYTRELFHRNILRFIDSGISEEGPYLIMEFADEGNLEDHMARNNGTLPVDQAIDLVQQCLQGLDYMHQKGIIHRDIKPENILLRKDGFGGHVPKLADFGLAKDFTAAGGSRLTRLGARMGSVFYMPPEQFTDAASVKEPADTYAIGVTLYYLLSGEYPYEFPTPKKMREVMVRQHLKSMEEAAVFMAVHMRIESPEAMVLCREPIPIAHRNSYVSSALAAVIDRAIRKEASERYATVNDFLKALDSLHI